MESILPYLLILACPLMMVFMMVGMHGRHAHGGVAHQADQRKGMLDEERESELVAVREQRDELEARVAELETQMSRLGRTRETQARITTQV